MTTPGLATGEIDTPESGMVFRFESIRGIHDFSSIDPANGVIRNVAIITGGIKARGHDLEVDDTTLAQMFSCASSKGKVPVKWNHKTGADAVNGYLTNFSLDRSNPKHPKLRADWHLLQSHNQYAHAMEMAEKMPDGIGLSASFQGDAESRNGKKFARCTDLVSVDLVANPAANPDGLFSADNGATGSVDRHFDYMQTNSNGGAATLGDVMNAVGQLQTQLSQQNQTIAALQDGLYGADGDGDSDYYDDEDADDDGFYDESESDYYDDDYGDEEDYDGYDDGYGEDGSDYADAYAGGGEGGGAFSALAQQVNYLSRRLAAEDKARVDAVAEHNFAVVEEKIQALMETANNLQAENEALRTALATSGARGVSFSAGASQPPTNFTAIKADLVAQGMSGAEAIRAIQREHPAIYFEHLKSRGVINL